VLELPSSIYLACWRMNLCYEGNVWSRTLAKQTFEHRVCDPRAPWQLIVLLGGKVRSCAFQKMMRESFEHATVGSKTFVTLPHPSGRCREWNDYANYSRAQRLLRSYTTLPIGGPG
jgi:hypothetical protein